jgi:hypothetical protein
VSDSLGNRDLKDFGIVTGNDNYYFYHGIVENGSEFFIMQINN